MTESTPRKHILPRLSRRRFLQACAGACIAGGGTLAYSHTLGTSNLRIEHVTVHIPHLATRWHNRRIVHLSDLHHGCTSLELISRALGMARDLAPDFLLLTGDLVDNKYADVAALARVLEPITRTIPTLGCTGNHDYGYDRSFFRGFCERLEGAGVRMLRNQVYRPGPPETIAAPGDLCFAGVDDLWRGEFDPAVLTRTPRDAAVIFLCHNPDGYDHLLPAPDNRFDLMLSGHTHGGQVCVPGFGPLILPVSNKKRHTGLYHPDPAHPHKALYITRGVGHLLKVRLFCPPEVTCITLTGGEGAGWGGARGRSANA